MSLKQLSPDETEALQWWVQLVTEAEIVCQNPKAVKSPHGYARSLGVRLWKKETVLPMIVDEWKRVANEGKLSEPLWPNTPRHRVNRVLENAA